MIDAFLTKQSKSKSNRLHMSNIPDRNVDSLARIRELSSSLIRIKKESKRLRATHTVKPRGSSCPGLINPSVTPSAGITVSFFSSSPISTTSAMFVRMNDCRHSAQKSKSFSPSSCFCSSVRRYLVWVTSNLPSPCKLTRQTRRFVPPVKHD